MSSGEEHLTGVERAAVLLFALGPQRASEVLRHMDVRDVELLGAKMAAMKNVSLPLLEAVLRRFLSAYEQRSVLGGDAEEFVRAMLTSALGAEKAEVMIDRVLLGGGHHHVRRLQWLDSRTLAEWARAEHPQVVANILVLLDGRRAADVLMALPESLRSNLVMRVAALEQVSPAALRELEEIIAAQWADFESARTAPVRGVNVAANILNNLDHSVSSQMLDEIAAGDDDLARQIQDKMYVFEELVNLDDRGMQTLLREVATERLLLALQGASEHLKRKIFSNMSKRAGSMLLDDLDAAEPAPSGEVEAAQKEILLIVRNLAESGVVAFGQREE